MKYDAIVVGGGIAGVTATAYLSREGYKTLLIEKEPYCGGLINSFTRDGFTYDGGIRATESAGVLFPMLKQLGLEVEFVKNNVTLGIEDRVMRVDSEDNLKDYQEMLTHFYPEDADAIERIIAEIAKIMHYMDIQYGIDNPAFLDPVKDQDYFIKEIFPWMFRFALTFRKVEALNKLLTAREQLSNLLTYMDGKTGAEELIAKVLKDPALLETLSAQAKPAADDAEEENA